jgi:SAM-dependent methyltransferase
VEPDEIRRQWAERSGEFSPDYYAYYGPDGTSDRILDLLDRHLDRSASVLELGCSSGRHLAHLHDHDFDDLSGIDVNAEAFEVMASTYPDLADAGTFHAGTIEEVVGDFEDGRFDAVYSVQTLQHVHPDAAWVFEELVRITDDLLVTVEVERGSGDEEASSDEPTGDGDPEVNYVNDEVPLYYRDWGRVFADLGLVEVETGLVDGDTLRAFRAGTTPT